MAHMKKKRKFDKLSTSQQPLTLITSGCSFSEVIYEQTWPLHLERQLRPKNVIHTGLGSQGNGMISRKAIHAVHNALKTHKPDDKMLVGIMWSGPSRH